MDSGVLQLILFAIVMLAGSYLSGSIPLYVPLSEDKLHKVSVMGAGLLLGTALAVIIPEGIQTIITVSDTSVDKAIGPALVTGFLFMLLIDQIASSMSMNGSSNSDIEIQPHILRRRIDWTTTLGLVVHAAADGIALGAAASTHHTDVEMIVFLAIMLHKAPAAFGLVTFLLHEGLERNRIRKHLLIFSISAPLTAIITFVMLYNEFTSLKSNNATGIAMLFSAGTFLYVATMHVLPEVSSGHSHTTSNDKVTLSAMELLMLIIGTLSPLLLTFGHHHHH